MVYHLQLELWGCISGLFCGQKIRITVIKLSMTIKHLQKRTSRSLLVSKQSSRMRELAITLFRRVWSNTRIMNGNLWYAIRLRATDSADLIHRLIASSEMPYDVKNNGEQHFNKSAWMKCSSSPFIYLICQERGEEKGGTQKSIFVLKRSET